MDIVFNNKHFSLVVAKLPQAKASGITCFELRLPCPKDLQAQRVDCHNYIYFFSLVVAKLPQAKASGITCFELRLPCPKDLQAQRVDCHNYIYFFSRVVGFKF